MIIQANNNNLCALNENSSGLSPTKTRNNKPLSFLYRNTNPLDYSPKLNANESQPEVSLNNEFMNFTRIQ